MVVALAGGLVTTTRLYLEAGAARRLADNPPREAEAINDFPITKRERGHSGFPQMQTRVTPFHPRSFCGV
jgi:hypothetical protein